MSQGRVDSKQVTTYGAGKQRARRVDSHALARIARGWLCVHVKAEVSLFGRAGGLSVACTAVYGGVRLCWWRVLNFFWGYVDVAGRTGACLSPTI